MGSLYVDPRPAGFVTWVPGTASLALPAVVGLAAAGFAGSWPVRRPRRASLVALAAAGAVFLAYGLPVLASGHATFAGYISLDDTSTWLALADRMLEEGRSLDGLDPSSYEATLATYLGGGKAFGPFVSRNLTPDKSGRPAGLTLTQFEQIMRHGTDLKALPPDVPGAPGLLQVMPWPEYRHTSTETLRAIYDYLSVVPCVEGGPGEGPNRCGR